MLFFHIQGLKVPHAKVGKVDDVSGAVSYLVSPQAHFITGEFHSLDLNILMRVINIVRPDPGH